MLAELWWMLCAMLAEYAIFPADYRLYASVHIYLGVITSVLVQMECILEWSTVYFSLYLVY